MKWLSAAAAAVLVPASAGAGTTIYTVGSFERIRVEAGIELAAQIGPAQSVFAETDGSDFSGLVIEVDDGTLVIHRPYPWFWSGRNNRPRFKVTVAVPALHGLQASSGASADVTGPISGDAEIASSSGGQARVAEVQGNQVVLDASSAGALDLGMLQATTVDMQASSGGQIGVDDLKSGAVAIRASSSGVVDASGSCETLSVSASSSARVLGAGLQCANVEADASSSGGIEAFASKGVRAEASSGGRVSVGGTPARVEQHQSSGGSINIGR